MSMLSLRLPDSIHKKARELSEREGISINQFIAMAVAEKLAALLTTKYLDERASRADREKFQRILARVPDVPPLPGDEIPPVIKARARRRSSRRSSARRR